MNFYVWIQPKEFAIPLVLPLSGGKTIKNTDKLPDSEHPSKFTCQISSPTNSGTGVIIALRNHSIKVHHHQVRMLILTAGHVIGTHLRHQNANTKFWISFEYKNYKYNNALAVLLYDYSNWSETPLLDHNSGFQYILPNDLAILAAYHCIRTDLQEILISEELAKGEKVYISGYPDEPSDILCTAPCLRDLPLKEARARISSAFHRFDYRVISEGTVSSRIKHKNQALLADYTATSGLSGAPVFKNQAGVYSLCGINLGGATVRYQYDLGRVISLINQENWQEAEALFNNIRQSIEISGEFNFQKLIPVITANTINIQFHEREAIESIISLVSLLAAWHNDPLKLNYNVAIPSKHPVMRRINEICYRFKDIPNRTVFRTFQDLWIALDY